jgi:prepilin peptidase CpaA
MLGLSVLGLLACLLMIAAWYDIKSHRIPNWLVASGTLLGLGLNSFLLAGAGFNDVLAPGGIGWVSALQGMGLGLIVLLPLYLMRAMGAGDVKLMAMVGAFLGPAEIQGALLGTFLTGGVMALLLAVRTKLLARLLQNVRLILLGGLIKVSAGRAPTMDDLPVSVGKLPYGVAIALGTLGFLAWQRMG